LLRNCSRLRLRLSDEEEEDLPEDFEDLLAWRADLTAPDLDWEEDSEEEDSEDEELLRRESLFFKQRYWT